MPLKPQQVGSFSQTPLVDVFRWVLESSFTGSIVFAHDDVKKSVMFDQGRPIAARSNIMAEALGQMLVAEGKLTEAQLSKSLQMLEGKEVHIQGQALLEMKLVDVSYLGDVLSRQLITRIHELFNWTDGRYAIVAEIPPDTARIDLPNPFDELIFRGLVFKYKASPQLESVKETFRPIMAGGHGWNIENFKLVGRELQLTRGITGTASVKDLIAKSRLDEPLAKSILLALRDLKILRLGDEPNPSREYRPPASGPKKSAVLKGATGIVAEIQSRMEKAEKQSLFELFGADSKTPSDAIKASYFELAKKYHPDRLPKDLSPEERKVAEDYFAKLSHAQTTLTNDQSRKEYEASLSVEASGIDAERAKGIIDSEIEFQKGLIFIRKGDFEGAMKALEGAVKLYNEEPEYLMQLGWAMYRHGKKINNSPVYRKGKEAIEKAVKEKPSLAQGFYFLGVIYKGENENEKAKKMFMKCLELTPHHNESKSELSLIERREVKPPAKGGLKGLFGKKS